MQKWLLALIAALIGIAVGWYAYSHRQQQAGTEVITRLPGKGIIGSAATTSDSFDVTIEYTDDGFKPAEIEIKTGERVRFLNSSSETFWPASGIHPTHSLYPEKEDTDCLGSSFDACAELKKGDFFDFTFYYPGEWRFHDHLHAYHTGVVRVSE